MPFGLYATFCRAALIIILIIIITASIVCRRRRVAAAHQAYITKPNTFGTHNQNPLSSPTNAYSGSPNAQEAGYGGYGNNQQWGTNATYHPSNYGPPNSYEPPSGYPPEPQSGYAAPNHTGREADNSMLPPPPSYDEGKGGQMYPPVS
jgi:hypothetical protein